MPTKEKVLEIIMRILLVLITNFLILLQVLSSIIVYGLQYFRTPKWRPFPKFLTDPKFGTHKYMYHEDINIHYVESGNPDRPLMLLVHGFPEFWYSWHHQITEFQKDYRVVAISMRGYCLSDKPQDVASYKMEHLVDDLKRLIEHLGYERCVLVGHDWGGAVCWAFGQLNPHMLNSLIILNCPNAVSFREVLRKNFKQILCSWYIFFFQMPRFPEWILSRMDYMMLDKCFNGSKMGLKKRRLTEEELNAYKANFMQPGVSTAAINYYRAALRSPMLLHNQINVPSLLIWGTEDGALTLPLAEACKLACPNLVVNYMDGSSHWVQQDMPDEVNSAMRDFLSKLSDKE